MCSMVSCSCRFGGRLQGLLLTAATVALVGRKIVGVRPGVRAGRDEDSWDSSWGLC